MPYQLSFDYLVNYDAGVPGISVPVQLALNGSPRHPPCQT
jgi:hypothetical protein